MKKVLVLVLSSDFSYYSNMITTSKKTWDSEIVEGCETIFYCSQNDNPNKTNYDNVMYFDVPNTFFDMGKKNLAMFEWALKNKDFDYVLRVNASQYVNKKEIVKYVQTLPNENVFTGLKVTGDIALWVWGGGGFVFSKDVIQKFVDNKEKWNHSVMEDKSLSYLATELGIPFIDGVAASIDNMGDKWRCMCYGKGESFEFNDFSEIVKAEGHFCFRIKQDTKRYIEEFISNELFKYLK